MNRASALIKLSISKLFASISLKEAIIGFSIWLAVLSLLLSIHAEVFEQEQEPMASIISKPLSRLVSPSPHQVDLSSLLKSKSLETPIAQANPAKPLYVFALDVSISMLDQKVSKEEIEQYFSDLKNPLLNRDSALQTFSFLPDTVESATTFDIARAELCRYVNSVPDGSLVAFWKFGNTPELMAPRNSSNNDRYVAFNPTERGGHPKKEIIDSISKLKAVDNLTDFEKLLHELSVKYRHEIESISEVHFIIISDFAHDIDGRQDSMNSRETNIDVSDTSIWRSRYRISASRISDHFRGISKNGGKTFHLAVVSGAHRVVCAILPIVGETLEMYSYRETKLIPNKIGKEFDFLRSYQESSIPLIFFYSPGDFRITPTQIYIDDAKYENSSIRLALASEAQVPDTFPLKIQTRFRSGSDAVKGLLSIDGGGTTGTVERGGDKIALQPMSTLQPREAATYRLLVSWNDRNGSDESKRTFAVPIIFYQQLSFYSALSILISEFFVLFFLGCAGYRLVKFFRTSKALNTVEKAAHQG